MVGRNAMRVSSSGPWRSPQTTGNRANACRVCARSPSMVCWTKHGTRPHMRWRHGSFDRFSGLGFSNIGRTEPNHVASRDGTSIARPHCSIGFCHSRCGSRTPAYHDTEWQSPSDLRGHYPAAAGRLQCAHDGRSSPPRRHPNADVRLAGSCCVQVTFTGCSAAVSSAPCGTPRGRRSWPAGKLLPGWSAETPIAHRRCPRRILGRTQPVGARCGDTR
jgi:hypothetical protein